MVRDKHILSSVELHWCTYVLAGWGKWNKFCQTAEAGIAGRLVNLQCQAVISSCSCEINCWSGGLSGVTITRFTETIAAGMCSNCRRLPPQLAGLNGSTPLSWIKYRFKGQVVLCFVQLCQFFFFFLCVCVHLCVCVSPMILIKRIRFKKSTGLGESWDRKTNQQN